MENKEQNTKKYMSAEETAILLSETMKDVVERKITLRHALTVSRIAIALAKVIEVVDLNNRVAFIEQTLKKIR
jgi:hypothetical protein